MFDSSKIASTLDAGKGVFVDLDANNKPIRVVAEAEQSETVILTQVRRAGWHVTLGKFAELDSELPFEAAPVLASRQATDAERDPFTAAAELVAAREAQVESRRYGLDAVASAGRTDRNARRARAETALDLASVRNQPNISWRKAREALAELQSRDPGNPALRQIVKASAAQDPNDFVSQVALMSFVRTASGGPVNRSIVDTIDALAIEGLRTSNAPEAQQAHARAAALAPRCRTAADYDRIVREYGLERDDFTRALLRAYAQEAPMDKDMPGESMGELPMDDSMPGDASGDVPESVDAMDPQPEDAMQEPADPMAEEPVVVSVPDPHDESRMLEVSIKAKDPLPVDDDAVDQAAQAPLPPDANEDFEVHASGCNGNRDGCAEDMSAKKTMVERFKAANLAVAEARVAALSGAKRVSAGVLEDGETRYEITSRGRVRQRTAKITRDETLRRCAALGLTESAVSSAILSGGRVDVAGWSISASSDGLTVNFGRTGSRVPRALPLASLDTQISDFRRSAAADARGVYRVAVDVPGTSISERRAAAKRIIAEVSAVMAPIGTAIDTTQGEVVLAYHGHLTKTDLTKIAGLVQDKFGLKVRGQYTPFVGPAQPKPAAGEPAQPMVNPMQTVNTSAANQQAQAADAAMSASEAAKNLAKPMQPSSAGAPGLDPLANPLQAPRTAAVWDDDEDTYDEDDVSGASKGAKGEKACDNESCGASFSSASGAECPKCGTPRKQEKKAQVAVPTVRVSAFVGPYSKEAAARLAPMLAGKAKIAVVGTEHLHIDVKAADYQGALAVIMGAAPGMFRASDFKLVSENQRTAQEMPPPAPNESVLGPMDDAGGVDMGADVQPEGVPAPGVPGGAPGMNGTSDPLGQSPLTPEEKQMLDAGVQHYRNTGSMPLEGVIEFAKDYGKVLDKYGKPDSSAVEASLPRQQVEISVLEKFLEVWRQPAVVTPPEEPGSGGMS